MAYEDTSLYNLLLAALSAPKRGFHAPVRCEEEKV